MKACGAELPFFFALPPCGARRDIAYAAPSRAGTPKPKPTPSPTPDPDGYELPQLSSHLQLQLPSDGPSTREFGYSVVQQQSPLMRW